MSKILLGRDIPEKLTQAEDLAGKPGQTSPNNFSAGCRPFGRSFASALRIDLRDLGAIRSLRDLQIGGIIAMLQFGHLWLGVIFWLLFCPTLLSRDSFIFKSS